MIAVSAPSLWQFSTSCRSPSRRTEEHSTPCSRLTPSPFVPQMNHYRRGYSINQSLAKRTKGNRLRWLEAPEPPLPPGQEVGSTVMPSIAMAKRVVPGKSDNTKEECKIKKVQRVHDRRRKVAAQYDSQNVNTTKKTKTTHNKQDAKRRTTT